MALLWPRGLCAPVGGGVEKCDRSFQNDLGEMLPDQPHFLGEGGGTQEYCYLLRVTSHFYASALLFLPVYREETLTRR